MKPKEKITEIYTSHKDIIQTTAVFFGILFVYFFVLPTVLGTAYPINSVLSASMEHHSNDWKNWLGNNNFSNEEIENLPFNSGINTGDMIFAKAPVDIKKGDIVLYDLSKTYSKTGYKINDNMIIIHRVIEIEKQDNSTIYFTKGDNNNGPDPFIIPENAIVGKTIFRIPLLGYPKKILNDILAP